MMGCTVFSSSFWAFISTTSASRRLDLDADLLSRVLERFQKDLLNLVLEVEPDTPPLPVRRPDSGHSPPAGERRRSSRR